MDSNALSVGRSVASLVQTRYGGDQRAAFNAYAGRGGEVDRAGLERLLRDAGVGNGLTRGFYVDGVMDRFDTGPRNGSISWAEYQSGLRSVGQ